MKRQVAQNVQRVGSIPHPGANASGTAFAALVDVLAETVPQVASAIISELRDQRERIKLVAGENYSSPATLLAGATWLTDKSAEGTVGHRFYAGCRNVDAVERIARDLALALFGADHAYVQPHSGFDANLIAYWAVLCARIEIPMLARLNARRPADATADDWGHIRRELGNQRLLSMSTDAGGHVSHGSRANLSGRMFDVYHYGVDPASETIDYDAVARLAREVKPLILLAGHSSYPRLIDFERLAEIAASVRATLMVDMAHFAGLVAGKAITGRFNPVPYADIVTSTTHKTLRGPRGGFILCKKEYADAVDRGCPLAMSAPMPSVLAAKATAFYEASRPLFAIYARRVIDNAAALAQGIADGGLRLVSGGTENHIVLVDVSEYGLNGLQAESALSDADISCNRNLIPFDRQQPWYSSGVRLGTPAVTTLGMGEAELKHIGGLVAHLLRATRPHPDSPSAYLADPAVFDEVRSEVGHLTARFRPYDWLDAGTLR